MKAIIIGNGKSREQLDLEELKTKGVTFGCNALHRDFSPHYLVAIDRKMQNEIIAAKYYENNKVLLRSVGTSQHIPDHPNVHRFSNRISSPNNSGMAAIWFAMKRGFKHVYLVGFDFETPGTKKQANVYSGTPGYERHAVRPPKVPMNVPGKLGMWARDNEGKVEIIRVYDPEYTNMCEKVKGFEFIRHITYGEFKDELY